jgi:Glycosyl hydrolase family 67 C-terminus
MSRRTPLLVAALAVVAGLFVALAFERVYDVRIRTRPPDPLAAAAISASGASARGPLTLRLVDSGGVGMPLDAWGTDYSHDRRVFHDAILERSPYVDAGAFSRIETEWRAYVERMLQYGNNAISVPLLLELIDFDRVTAGDRAPGAAVYDGASPFRARHAALRRSFEPLFEWTDRRGMQVFLESDMLMLTSPLEAYLRRLAPDASLVGIDSSNPAVWEVYRKGLEELFEKVPAVKGLVIRFGEGGRLYSTPGWPYRSEMAVRNADSVRAMLRGLLPAFERTGRTRILRSWTVGVGPIGRLHFDPSVYERVLGDIDSPALVVSTKFTAGDFFSYLPLNPTLAHGRHRRLVELQAKPEFEGFAAFPDFLAEEHARALRALRAANPRIVGSYLFTQIGGPLRAGPRTLYPFHGFWLWTDANVFAASRLAIDPDADLRGLARQWAERTFGTNARVVDAVTRALVESRKTVLDGFYIRPFAEREVRVPGLELPPLMWIFEWDMVGGWHSLLSLVYQGARDGIERAKTEGDSAAATVRRLRQEMETAAADPRMCQPCAQALQSLAYQETLFDVLAAWRQTFLSYYRWLETGDGKAWSDWRAGRTRFEHAARRHTERFGGNLDFPAFDLTSASRFIVVAERGAAMRTVAAGIVIMVVALVLLGLAFVHNRRVPRRLTAVAAVARVTAMIVVAPWRLRNEPVDWRTAAAVTTFSLAVVAVLAGTLSGFATWRIEGGAVILCAIVGLAFETTANGERRFQERGRLLVASVAPLMPGAAFVLALFAYVGPLGFWYWFWTSAAFRVVVVTIVIATPLWTVAVILAVRARDGWRGPAAGWLMATGAVLLVLAALLPDWRVIFRSLDHPLNVAPATSTILFALQTYAGVRLQYSALPYVGALLFVTGFMTWVRSPRRGGQLIQSLPSIRICR